MSKISRSGLARDWRNPQRREYSSSPRINPRDRDPSTFEYVATLLARLRSIGLNALALSALLLLLWASVRELQRDVWLVHAFDVPAFFTEDTGIAGKSLARRLSEHLLRIRYTPTQVSDEDESYRVRHPGSLDIDIEMAGTTTTLSNLVEFVRQFIGQESSHISGEVYKIGSTYYLRVYYGSGRDNSPHAIPFTIRDEASPESALQSAARQVAFRINPIALGHYLQWAAPTTDENRDAAIDAYERAIRLEHETKRVDIDRLSGIYNNLAIALARRDRNADSYRAFKLYEAAKSLGSIHWAFHYNMGAIFQSRGDLESAVSAYSSAYAAAPNEAAVNFGLAVALSTRQAEGDRERAIQLYRSAIRFDPDFADAYWSLANLLANQGKTQDFDTPVRMYEHALRLAPTVPKTYGNLANLLRYRDQPGDMVTAISLYRDATRLDPNSARYHGNLALALMERGSKADLEESFLSFERALQLDPSDFHALLNYANAITARNELGDSDEAVSRFQHLVDLYPGHPAPHVNLAVALGVRKNRGDLQKARNHLLRAIELGSPEAKSLLGKLEKLEAATIETRATTTNSSD